MTTWQHRLQLAAQTGRFDSDNDKALDRWAANRWESCAVSEMDTPKDHEGRPDNPEVVSLGRQFYRAVHGNLVKEAVDLYRRMQNSVTGSSSPD